LSDTVVRVDRLIHRYPTFTKQPGIRGAWTDLFHRRAEWTSALGSLDLVIHAGEIVGLLGPNGAGKTSLLKILSGIIQPTGGSVSVWGHTPYRRAPAFLLRLGIVLGQKSQLDWNLPALDTYLLLKEIYRIPPAAYHHQLDALSAALHVTEVLTTPVRKLSLGERMKCELVASLLHRPALLLLDEPTIGLDVESQRTIRAFLRTMNQSEGTTIVLTSHYTRDIEDLAQRTVILVQGQVRYDGSPDALLAPDHSMQTVRFEVDPRDATWVPPGGRPHGDGWIEYVVPRASLSAFLMIMAAQVRVLAIATEPPALEEVLLTLFESARTRPTR